MKKILIFGMTPNIGGIESYLISILQNIDKEKFSIDLLVKDNITGINAKKIKNNYNNIYKIPNIKRHPLKCFTFVKKLSKNNKYDVAHFNYCTSAIGIYAFIIKKFSKRTRIFIHSHNGNDKCRIQHYILRPLVNKVADLKLACSEVAARWMFGKKAMERNEVILCNNFIDTDKFLFNKRVRDKLRNELNIKDKFVIGHIGRFTNQKNHKGLIDIFSHIKNDNAILMLLGTGELEEEIKSYVEKLHLKNRVLFLGVKENVNEYYQAMDLFILPSFFEGLPVVGIEAQVSGLKCIFSDTIDKKSDISGNVEFISLDEIEKWKDAINKLIKNGYKRNNMKNIAIKSGYDLNNEIHKIENLYLKGGYK